MTATFKLAVPKQSDFPRLLEIWEASVRATHDFVTDGDIELFKTIIKEQDMFGQTNLTCACTADNIIVGFIGVSQEELEMIYIAPEYRGAGVGKALLLDATERYTIKKVEVNEQNRQAIGFYEHFGFVTVARSELDGAGNPFPILHMERV